MRACATLIARKTWPINDTGVRNVRRLDFLCFILTCHRFCDGSVYPESYPLDNKQRGQAQPHDQNDFDAYMASGLIVTINAPVATKEATPVAEDVGAGEQMYLCCCSRSTGDSMAGLILTSSLAHIELKQANNKSARD